MSRHSIARRTLTALALVASICGGSAVAQEPTSADQAPTALAGTLARIQKSGSVAIGYRDASIPFSYVSARGEPIGYSIELCKSLVVAISEAVHRPLSIRWVPVTSATRFDAVVDGRIDLECGSTTHNVEREKLVGFSPTFFVAGTKVLVRKDSRIASFRDLAGKRIAVTAGTTNEKAIRDLDKRFNLGTEIIVSDDHAASFALVAEGKADAFATDDVLLNGVIADAKNRGDDHYKVVGEFLSYEPYAIAYRRGDKALGSVIDDAFRALATDGDMDAQYKRWFLQKLPSGASLDLPMSAQLATIIQSMTVGQNTTD